MIVKINGKDWYKVTSDFGNQHPAHETDYHTGIDLSIPEGTEIQSPISGIVEKVADFGDNGLGKSIYIKADDGNTLVLGHLSEINVEKGQHIEIGDLVALSGNSGHSTGAHLHIGLQTPSGNYIDPDKVLEIKEMEQPKWLHEYFTREEEMIISSDGSTILNGDTLVKDSNLFEFIADWRSDGFFQAMYGKSFFEVMKDFFKELFTDIGVFILSNSDIFFLLPAIFFMLGTFIIGRNRFTKWIIPLWFFYFLGTFFHKLLIA